MSERYPRFRYQNEAGLRVVSDAVVLCFFMRRSHGDMAQAVVDSLSIFRRTVGPERLCWSVDSEGDPQKLDESAWEELRRELLDPRWRPACTVRLRSEYHGGAAGFHVAYHGQWLDNVLAAGNPHAVSLISFQLPTEYLEELGPHHVRELALALAEPLPFNSGHGSLAFCHEPVLGTLDVVRRHCFRYPGMDVHELTGLLLGIGTRVRGAYWLTFLGQPVLGQLGGISQLRPRLTHPGVSLQEMSGERLLISLGEWPETGDMDGGVTLPHYRQLARLLEPSLYHETVAWHAFSKEQVLRWERRLLD